MPESSEPILRNSTDHKPRNQRLECPGIHLLTEHVTAGQQVATRDPFSRRSRRSRVFGQGREEDSPTHSCVPILARIDRLGSECWSMSRISSHSEFLAALSPDRPSWKLEQSKAFPLEITLNMAETRRRPGFSDLLKPYIQNTEPSRSLPYVPPGISFKQFRIFPNRCPTSVHWKSCRSGRVANANGIHLPIRLNHSPHPRDASPHTTYPSIRPSSTSETL